MSDELLPGEDNFFHLPPHTVDKIFQFRPLSQSIDWGISSLLIPELWTITKGAGVVVSVLDTGVDHNHPDLKEAIVGKYDMTRSASGTMDRNGHGTHCNGTIGARNNEDGVVGAAPECQLLPIKVLGDNGSGSGNTVALGIRKAIELGVDIISLSLGAPSPDRESQAAVREAAAAGIWLIAAGGNEGPRENTLGYPGKYPESICIGATDQNRRVTNFSSRGDNLDVCTPGYQILSTFPGGKYSTMSGTSMATPLCAGILALIRSVIKKAGFLDKFPQAVIERILRETSDDIASPGKDTSGGFGLVNPTKLMNSVQELLKTYNPNPPSPPVIVLPPSPPVIVLPPSPPVIPPPGPTGDLIQLVRSDFTDAGLNKIESLKGKKAAFTGPMGTVEIVDLIWNPFT